MLHMKYDVVIKRKVAKGLRKLPVWVQKKMAVLAEDLREKGPEQLVWQNYSKLSQTEYHCHLGTSWVFCWRHQSRTIIIYSVKIRLDYYFEAVKSLRLGARLFAAKLIFCPILSDLTTFLSAEGREEVAI